MKSILRPATAVLISLVLAPGAIAQVLTTAEVRTLIANRQPEDHTKLQAHFAALAARFAADAERHEAFARSASGTNRGTGAAAARHHERMAELATESARITRDLAEHHRTLAAGRPSTAPRGAEKFEAGAAAPTIPSEHRLAVRAAGASTPSEHGQVREYYLMLARHYEQSARDLRFMAQMYRGRAHPSEHQAVQCDRLAKLAGSSASEARALAKEHE